MPVVLSVLNNQEDNINGESGNYKISPTGKILTVTHVRVWKDTGEYSYGQIDLQRSLNSYDIVEPERMRLFFNVEEAGTVDQRPTFPRGSPVMYTQE